jgi:hypothetical protein
MNYPTIEVLLLSRDALSTVCFRVFTNEQKAACIAAGDGANEFAMSTEEDAGGRKFQVVRADGAKIWEHPL